MRRPVDVVIWIPCRNYEQYLPEAVASVYNQTVQCAIVVAHDACGHLDEPVGLSKNRNSLLWSIFDRFQYVVYLDADDRLPVNYVEELLRVAQGDNCVVTCPAEFFGEQTGGVLPVEHVTKETLLSGNTIHCSALIPIRILKHAGGYDESLQAWEDWELWMRLVSIGTEFRTTDKTKLMYRRHWDSMNRRYMHTEQEMREWLKARYCNEKMVG